MSRPELVHTALLSTLTPAEKSKFTDILCEFETQKFTIKDIQNHLTLPESNKPSIENTQEEDYWECKWAISNAVGIIYLVSGRQLSRWGVAAALVDEKLYMFGGRGADSRPRNSFHILDLATGHFSLFRTVNTPKGRDGHSMSAYKNLLIIYGGCEDGSNESDPFDDVWVVDIETRVWSKPHTTGKRPEAREGHAAGIIKNFMVIYGGSGRKNLLSNIFIFNLITFEWKEIEQYGYTMGPRESMSCTTLNDSLYIFGGNTNYRTKDVDEYTDDFFVVTLKNNSAHCKKIITESPIPPKRLSHSLNSLNSKYLILFGGESFDQALNDLWVYSIEKNIWHEVKPQNQITPRMAHVCSCYKDSVFIFGGMTQDQSVKSDLAVLKFGKSEINISSGSGINPKRKFTKLLNVTSRTVPSISHQEVELSSVMCEKCGHAAGSCAFISRFQEMKYPMLNYFPRIQIAASCIEQLSCQFQDPFAAMLRIAEVLGSPNVSFAIIGTANMRGNQIVKLLHSEAKKEVVNDGIEGQKNQIFQLIKPSTTMHVPILEISSKVELNPDQVAMLCSGVSSNSFIPGFFRLSDTIVVISRTEQYLTVALLYKDQNYTPLFFSVFDSSLEPIYPCKELIYPNMVNVYSRTHLQSGDIFRHLLGTTIYLYTKELESIVGDILYQGNSFISLVSKLKRVQYIVAGSLVKREKFFKDDATNKQFLVNAMNYDFAVLVYVKKKLAYWEFKKCEKGKKSREKCDVWKLVDEGYLSRITGQLLWDYKTLNLFADIYSGPKKRCIE